MTTSPRKTNRRNSDEFYKKCAHRAHFLLDKRLAEFRARRRERNCDLLFPAACTSKKALYAERVSNRPLSADDRGTERSASFSKKRQSRFFDTHRAHFLLDKRPRQEYNPIIKMAWIGKKQLFPAQRRMRLVRASRGRRPAVPPLSRPRNKRDGIARYSGHKRREMRKQGGTVEYLQCFTPEKIGGGAFFAPSSKMEVNKNV